METGKILTGYPSIDRPWLKYYSEELINAKLPECTAYDYLWESNKNNLNEVALIYFDKQITYGELFSNIDKAARTFAGLGITEGDIVVMATVTTPETIYAFYALNLIGAIANMVDPRTSSAGIREYILEVDAHYVLTLNVAYPKIKEATIGTNIKKIIVTSPADSLPRFKRILFDMSNKLKGKDIKIQKEDMVWRDLFEIAKRNTYRVEEYKNNTCCAIEHTGGTTGMPKGVMLSNDNFNAASAQIKSSPLNMKRGDIFLNIMPPFIAYGMVLGIHTALTHGWKCVIIPNFEPQKFCELILKYRPAGIMGVPTHFEGLMGNPKLENKNLDFIKVALVGGDKIQVEFEKKVNAFFSLHGVDIHISKGYSMTEASASATITYETANKLGSAGIPNVKTIVSVFDPETNEELKVGETGEVCILTPTMMLGYYGKDEETKAILKSHADGRVWIHSGDLGHIDEDGCIFIDGRLKRMIIRHDGFKVFPSFIENVIAKHDAVKTCCAVGKIDMEHRQGKLPIVFATLKSGCSVDEVKKELFELCQKELPEYVQPVDFVFINKLPLTSIGKVDYRALEKQVEKS